MKYEKANSKNMYSIGTILVLGAGVLLVTRRRMNME